MSANSTPKGQASTNLSLGFDIKMSKTQAFYFYPLSGNLLQGYFDTLLKISGAYLLTAYPGAML